MRLQGTYKEIRDIAMPIIIGGFAQSINQLIDTAFISRLGEAHLGGATLSGMMYYMFCMMFWGFTRGGQILLARASGQNNHVLIGRIFGQMLIFSVILLLTNGLILFYGQRLLIDTFIINENIKPYADVFLQYRMMGLPMVMFASVFQSFFTGLGDTRIITWSTIIMALVNICLDWAMIFGHLGFEPMGVKGAALATSIAEGLWFLVFLFYFIVKRYGRIYTFSFYKIRFQPYLLRRLVILSLPLVGQNLMGLGSWFFFFQAIEKYGERALAISGIMKGIYVFILVPGWGFATTANTMISNIFGQDRKDEIIPVLRKLMIVSGSVCTLICIGLGLFPKLILSMFSSEISLIHEAIPIYYIVLVALVVFGISCVYFQAVAAVGATQLSLVFEIVCVIAYTLYLYITMYAMKTSLWVAWLGEYIYWFIIILLSVLYIRSGKWKSLPINIEDEKEMV
jgi:putative MATE family efflux protein